MPTTEALEITLLSGVIFPDWTVVTSEKVRKSLNDTLGRLRMNKRWAQMSPIEETIRRAILNLYVGLGHAPSFGELSEELNIPIPKLVGVLASLEERDLIIVSKSEQIVEVSYPFTHRKTEHQVRIGDVTLAAMCAIDALGAGAMLNHDTEVLSKCRHCGSGIQIHTANNGRAIKSVAPASTVVWSGLQDIEGCAADTQCGVMAFFCSDGHLATWREERNGSEKGHRLSVEQGLEAGAAIFIPFLATDKVVTEQLNQKAI